MIRRSALVAVAAVFLSLILHGMGLDLTFREHRSEPSAEAAPDVSDTGGTFADYADVATEPEQPSVTTPDPVIEEIPTSDARVASDNPQDVLVPDTGTAEVIEPDASEPLESESSVSQAEEPSGTEDETTQELAALQPDDPTSEEATPETSPDAAEPLTSNVQEPEAISPDASEPDQVPNAAAPLEAEPSEAEQPDIIVASRPEDPEILTPEDSEDLSRSAVTRSLRPPQERPTAEDLGATAAAESQSDVYQRTGLELLALGGVSTASGSSQFSGSFGVGNATASNYAGEVLVRLNRAPKVYQSESGTAQVQFQIDPDGSVAWVRVLRSSGTQGINRAAAAQVRTAAPFPRPPTGNSVRLVFVYRNQ